MPTNPYEAPKEPPRDKWELLQSIQTWGTGIGDSEVLKRFGLEHFALELVSDGLLYRADQYVYRITEKGRDALNRRPPGDC